MTMSLPLVNHAANGMQCQSFANSGPCLCMQVRVGRKDIEDYMRYFAGLDPVGSVEQRQKRNDDGRLLFLDANNEETTTDTGNPATEDDFKVTVLGESAAVQ